MAENSLLLIKRPEDLFPGDPAQAKQLFHDLALKWHPDRNKGRDEVFKHIKQLYEDGVAKMESGAWEGSGELHLLMPAKCGIPYIKSKPFDLGRMYIADDCVVYVVEKRYEDLFNHGLAMAQTCEFASPRMCEEMERYLPTTAKAHLTKDGKLAMRVRKTSDLILLRDVLDYYGGAIESRHVAWIQSSLHNLACYLSWAQVSHNDISPDTYFISPQHHGGALLGGWWYATTFDRRIEKLPQRTYRLLPWEVQKTKLASPQIDLELVRATGKELLGKAKNIPDPMAAWFRGVASKDAVSEYGSWKDHVLTSSFGARRFVVMNLTAETLYKAPH